MGIEDQIAVRLRQGATPTELLAAGFRKSTVYKVAEALRSHLAPSPQPLLVVQLQSDHGRYLPGGLASLSFTVTNNSASDLYGLQTGLRPESLGANEWIPTTVRKLLGAGDSMTLRVSLPIPPHVSLGEKDLYFGIQGQWVGPQSASPSNDLMWTGPLLLRIQRPPSGTKVFLSYSGLDAPLISRLEGILDDNGIATIVADGELLLPAIDQADFFLAVVTDTARLASVNNEVARAHARTKPLVLLRDTSLTQSMPPELAPLPWTDVDFSPGDASIVVHLMAALTSTIQTKMATRKKEQDDTLGVIVLGLAALAAAIALGRGKPG